MKTVEILEWPKGAAPTQHVYDPPPHIKFARSNLANRQGFVHLLPPRLSPDDIIVKISQVYVDENIVIAEVDGYKCRGG